MRRLFSGYRSFSMHASDSEIAFSLEIKTSAPAFIGPPKSIFRWDVPIGMTTDNEKLLATFRIKWTEHPLSRKYILCYVYDFVSSVNTDISILFVMNIAKIVVSSVLKITGVFDMY